MRALALRELEFVAGGDDLEEVPVWGRRDRWSGQDGGSGGSNYSPANLWGPEGGDNNLEEVVVEAPKMTEKEKAAYDAAKARAEATLVAMEAAGVGITAWVAAQSSAVQKGFLAAIGFVAGYMYMERREGILEVMTNTEFYLDGLDGEYDGIVDETYRRSY